MTKFLIILLFLFTSIKETKTLVIGDSISAYVNGWQDMLCKSKGLNCSNLSKGGKKTQWMYLTLKSELENNQSYSQVILYGGINDIFSHSSIDSAVVNMQRMVSLCNEYNIKPIIVIGYNPNTVMYNTWIKDKKAEAKLRNRYVLYQRRIEQIKNCKIIPKVSLSQTDSSDGIHFNKQGHVKFYRWVSRYF